MTPNLPPLEDAIATLAAASAGSIAGVRALHQRIAPWLWRQPVGVLRALDRRFRDRGVLGRLGLDPLARWTPPDDALVGWTLASLQRNGFARQDAVYALGGQAPDRWSVSAVVNRVVDPVEPVADAARHVLPRLVASAGPGDLAAALPMVDAVAKTRRGRDLPEIATLEAGVGAVELRRSLREGTEDVRLACLRRLVASPDAESALLIGLVDRSPRVRCLARDAVRFAERTVQDGLAEVMAASPAPDIRRAALQTFRRAGDVATLRQACYDPDANVRFYARRYLSGLRGGDGLLEDAIARLDSGLDSGRDLVGALALVGDLGGSAEHGVVRRYLTDLRPLVAREAARTWGLLG